MENFRRNIESVFCYFRDLKMSWLVHFPKFNKLRVWNKNVLDGKFSKKIISMGVSIKGLRVFKYENECSGIFKSNFPIFKTSY